MREQPRDIELSLEDLTLPGLLEVPDGAAGLVVFAHGSGSSRHSPRNNAVADGLRAAGLGTLLFDLLTEDEGRDRRNVFDIGLLGRRLADVVDAVTDRDEAAGLPIGLFGASTGAAAALDAAAARPDRIRAVVSRGGRPDLAQRRGAVQAPVLLIVGGADTEVLRMNRGVADELGAEVSVVPGAGHRFEGPGELEQVTELARDWFLDHLG